MSFIKVFLFVSLLSIDLNSVFGENKLNEILIKWKTQSFETIIDRKRNSTLIRNQLKNGSLFEEFLSKNSKKKFFNLRNKRQAGSDSSEGIYYFFT
jgi:hypothetical protein